MRIYLEYMYFITFGVCFFLWVCYRDQIKSDH